MSEKPSKASTDSKDISGLMMSSMSAVSSSLSRTYDVPRDWAEEAYDEAFVLKEVGDQSLALYKGKLNMLYGTTPAMVITSFLKSLFLARKAQNPKQLLIDMIFSVFVSQTVSKEWANTYNQFPVTTLFKPFEITGGRNVDPKVPHSQWVASSFMNATAVGMLGHAIVHLAPEGTSLARKAASGGTIFAPKKKDPADLSEYGKITLEVSKTLTEADFEALDIMDKKAGHLIQLVAKLLESNSSDIAEITAALSALKIKKF
jgi:hypothetical protein